MWMGLIPHPPLPHAHARPPRFHPLSPAFYRLHIYLPLLNYENLPYTRNHKRHQTFYRIPSANTRRRGEPCDVGKNESSKNKHHINKTHTTSPSFGLQHHITSSTPKDSGLPTMRQKSLKLPGEATQLQMERRGGFTPSLSSLQTGFITWNGMAGKLFQFRAFPSLTLRRTPHVIVDTSGRIFVALVAPPPNDPTWDDAIKDAIACLYSCHDSKYTKTNFNGRRGNFSAISAGVTAGNSQWVSATLISVVCRHVSTFLFP